MKTLLIILSLILILSLPLSHLLTREIEKLLEPQALTVKAARLENLSPKRQIKRIFGPDARLALAIFTAESHLNCKAISRTGDYGIAQLHHQPILDCTQNLLRAKQLFDKRGFEPWTSYKTLAYKRYLR